MNADVTLLVRILVIVFLDMVELLTEWTARWAEIHLIVYVYLLFLCFPILAKA